MNTLVLALDKYPSINNQLDHDLDIINIVFFGIFTVEMLIKITGMGPRNYIRDNFNIFDALIITLSVADVCLNFTLTASQMTKGKGAISAFRAFRLMRVFKLAKSWTQLNNLIKTIMKSLRDISSFSILLLLLIYIYILLGMQVFAKSNQIRGPPPN
jgi:Ion transport protein